MNYYLIALDVRDGLKSIEKQILIHTLRMCNGNRTLAAKMLKTSLRTIRNKMKAHGLRDEFPAYIECVDCGKKAHKFAKNAQYSKCFFCLNQK